MNLFIIPFPPSLLLPPLNEAYKSSLTPSSCTLVPLFFPHWETKFHTHLKQQETLWFCILQSLYSEIANSKRQDSITNGSMNFLISIGLYVTLIKLTKPQSKFVSEVTRMKLKS
jgi:hypothetical protein